MKLLRNSKWAAANASWIVSEFHHPKTAFGNLPSRTILRSLYLAVRITRDREVNRLPDHWPALGSSGFELFCAGVVVLSRTKAFWHFQHAAVTLAIT